MLNNNKSIENIFNNSYIIVTQYYHHHSVLLKTGLKNSNNYIYNNDAFVASFL